MIWGCYSELDASQVTEVYYKIMKSDCHCQPYNRGMDIERPSFNPPERADRRCISLAEFFRWLLDDRAAGARSEDMRWLHMTACPRFGSVPVARVRSRKAMDCLYVDEFSHRDSIRPFGAERQTLPLQGVGLGGAVGEEGHMTDAEFPTMEEMGAMAEWLFGLPLGAVDASDLEED